VVTTARDRTTAHSARFYQIANDPPTAAKLATLDVNIIQVSSKLSRVEGEKKAGDIDKICQ
jgi:hypothetical protein